MYKLGKRSIANLAGVHEDLVNVVKSAIVLSDVDFAVLEGLRSAERQKSLFAAGATRTLNSRHLTGHAVDLGAFVKNEIRWDWPLYDKIADAMKAAAAENNIPIVWGGDWLSFKDGPHFELDRKEYP